MKKITARIEKTKDLATLAYPNSLFLIIENGKESSAHPILEEEIEAILIACEDYLEAKDEDTSKIQ